MVIAGGGGGRANPVGAAPGVATLALVWLTEADTHLKNWLKASGLMSFITKTDSVMLFNLLVSAPSPQARAMMFPGFLFFNSSAYCCQVSVGLPSVSRKTKG